MCQALCKPFSFTVANPNNYLFKIGTINFHFTEEETEMGLREVK